MASHEEEEGAEVTGEAAVIAEEVTGEEEVILEDEAEVDSKISNSNLTSRRSE